MSAVRCSDLCRACAILLTATRAGAGHSQPISPATTEQTFDLPAQPLGTALAAIAKTTHFNVVAESDVVSRARSVPLHGRFTPQAALQSLLVGTGLAVTFTGPRSAVVYRVDNIALRRAPAASAPATLELDPAEVRATAPVHIGGADLHLTGAYARQAETEIQEILDGNPAYHGKPLHLLVAITVDADGRIRQVRINGGNDESARDRTLPTLLLGRGIGAAPPEGLVQPMWFDVSVDGSSPSQQARER